MGFFMALLLHPRVIDKAAEGLIVGFKKINQFLDEDQDGVIDDDEIDNVLAYIEVVLSIMAHAAFADQTIQEAEENEVIETMASFLEDDEEGNPPLLSAKLLKKLKLTQTEISEQMAQVFANPRPIGSISNFAKENEMQALIYELACIVTSADKTINEEERDFLNDLSEELSLSSMDRKRIEKIYLS